MLSHPDMPFAEAPTYLGQVWHNRTNEHRQRVAALVIEISDNNIFEYVRDRRVTLAMQIGAFGEKIPRPFWTLSLIVLLLNISGHLTAT